jgi:gluconate 2-dehydrogenase gamma chain
MENNMIKRRKFIQMGLFGAGSMLLLPGCLSVSGETSWRFFTKKEASLIDAIVEQIIPSNKWAGAKEAGVTNFIDKQLVGPYVRYQEKYKKSLAAVEASCINLHGKLFEELAWNEQTGFLEKMEAGKLSFKKKDDKTDAPGNAYWEEGGDKSFFNLIKDHTMQGFYGSPRHGGNKGYVSYKMIGLDYPHVMGQNRYNSKYITTKIIKS